MKRLIEIVLSSLMVALIGVTGFSVKQFLDLKNDFATTLETIEKIETTRKQEVIDSCRLLNKSLDITKETLKEYNSAFETCEKNINCGSEKIKNAIKELTELEILYAEYISSSCEGENSIVKGIDKNLEIITKLAMEY